MVVRVFMEASRSWKLPIVETRNDLDCDDIDGFVAA